jgi:hypothetical protein
MRLLYRFAVAVIARTLSAVAALAQGTLQDYERAQKFLPGNLRHLVYVADVNPHWIEKLSRFWYRKDSLHGSEFVLVDAEQNTSTPAFDHVRLASGVIKGGQARLFPV